MQADPDAAAIHSLERGTGPYAIVFLHGFGASHGVWEKIAAALPHDTRTIAYDLPGHGLSLDAAGAGSAKFAARTILADLSKRDIGAVHVVGHSMGGAVATLLALAGPQRIASLTLLAPGGFGPEIDGPLLRRYAEAVDIDEIRACLAAMSGEGAAICDDTLNLHLAMRARSGQTGKLIEIAAAITRDDRQGVIPHESLASLAMPVTVLWGTNDPVVPFSQAATLPAHFTLHAIRNAGHMLIEEAPDCLGRTIGVNLANSI